MSEFAKEAMSCQKLDFDEVLSIRWAHDDPNPVAKDSIERADKDAMVALLRAKGISLTPAGFNYPAEYQLPEAKRLKVEEGGSIIDQNPDLAYPDTAAQYAAYYASMATGNASLSSSSSSVPWDGYNSVETKVSSVDDKKNALARLGLLDNQSAESHPVEGSVEQVVTNGQVEREDDGDDEGGWQKFSDETTGAIYYFNTSTGESSWTEPEGYVSQP